MNRAAGPRPRTPKQPLRALTWAERGVVWQAYRAIPGVLRRMPEALHLSGESREDAVQEIAVAFIRRLQGLHPYDPSRGKLSTYLSWLARTWLLDAKKKNRRRYRRTKSYCEAMSLAA